MIISKNNLLEADSATVTNSTEVAGYEFENAFLQQRRTKTWRTVPRWELTADALSFEISDDGLAFVTVNLTAAVYTTAGLITHLETALGAAGVANYDVTYTSGFFKITSDMSGGASAFKMNFIGFDRIADILGYASAVYSGATNYTAPSLRTHTNEDVLIDLGVTTKIYVCALFGANNENIGISSDAVITLSGNETADFSSPSYSIELENDFNSFSISDKDSLGTYRFWRIRIVDHNVNGFSEINTIHLGDSFLMSQGAVQFPFEHDFRDMTTVFTTESGNIFRDFKQQTQAFSLEARFLSKSEAQNLKDYISDIGLRKNFVVSLDPDGVISDNSLLTKLVRFVSTPKVIMTLANHFSVSMELEEVL